MVSPAIGKTRRMADFELLTLDRRDDGVAVLTLANGKVNALSQELLAEIRGAVENLTEDLPGAVVVTGGDRLLAAGADISQFGGPQEAAEIARGFHSTLDTLAAFPRFVIAAVSGYALGGGCELALACDYRIASDKAVFGQLGAHPRRAPHRLQHHRDPPKIAAAYNAGSLRRTSSNRWHMVSTGSHINRFVLWYNAYRAWEAS